MTHDVRNRTLLLTTKVRWTSIHFVWFKTRGFHNGGVPRELPLFGVVYEPWIIFLFTILE